MAATPSRTALASALALALLTACGGSDRGTAAARPSSGQTPTTRASDSPAQSASSNTGRPAESSASPDNPWAGARTVIVSSDLVGEHLPSDPVLSADGSQVAFSSSRDFVDEIYVRAVDSGAPAVVSTTSAGEPADYDRAGLEGEAPSPYEVGSFEPSLSADGAVVAFASSAVNLVPGDTNQAPETSDLRAETGFDIFVKDLRTGRVVRASTTADGSQAEGESRAPSLSGDGRTVAFVSSAANLVPGDTNGNADVFVKNLDTGAIVRVEANSEWDADADYDEADELRALDPVLSGDGSTVAFVSDATDLVAGDDNKRPDVFVQTLSGGPPIRASQGRGGGGGAAPSLSADGKVVGFTSAATLIAKDTNGTSDVYVRDLRTDRLSRASTSTDGGQYRASSFGTLSGDGTAVVFVVRRPFGTDGLTQEGLMVKDLRTDRTSRVGRADVDDVGISAQGDRVVSTRTDAGVVSVSIRRG